MKKLYIISAILLLPLLLPTFSIAQQWYSLNSGTTARLQGIKFTDTNIGYIVGESGTILKTTDAGISWVQMNSGITSEIHSVFFIDSDTGYAAADFGKIIKTTDAGNSWTVLNSGTSNNLLSVYFTDSVTGYVCGALGLILKTTNAGATWSSQTSGTSQSFYDIYFNSISGKGYVVGELATIKYTTNGGSFWQSPNNVNNSNRLYSVTFIDDYKGFSVGLNGTILNCIDGGLYWDPVTSGTSNYLLDVYFTSVNSGYISGGSGTILKTTDGGSTWASLTSGTTEDLYGVYFTDATTGYAVGTNGKILKTCNLSANAGSDKSICSGNSADIGNYPVAGGGTSPYTYSWSPATGLSDSTIEHPIASPPSFSTYDVTVTDAGGCTATDQVNVYVSPVPSASFSTVINVTCNGGNDGYATVNASGGTSPYSFAYSAGSWTSGQSSATASTLTAGTYIITVTGGNGCSDIDSVTITEPPAVIISVSQTNVTCNGGNDGTATANVTGGTPGYTYYWNPGSQPTQTAIGLSAGNYVVSVNDVNGCNASVNVVITEPSVLVADGGTLFMYCSEYPVTIGGSPSASGGTSPYTYVWSPSASLSSTTIANPDASPPSQTNYSLVVNDANGCADTATVIVQVSLPASVTVSSTNISCNGANDGIAIASGEDNYTWSNGTSNDSISVLSPGTYYVTATDIASGCTDVDSVTITEPTTFTGGISSTNVSCFGGNDGTATAGGTGGTTPYSYLWFNGMTAPTISNLSAGSYSVTISDANGCGNLQYWATVGQPAVLTVTVNFTTDVSCNGNADGSVTVSAAGGTGTYSFLWSNGATAPSISGLVAGNYTVTVTDANSCTATANATITEPAALDDSPAYALDVACNGDTLGMVDYTVLGGTTPFTFVWSNGDTTQQILNLAAGTYSVTLTDANGCQINNSYNVNEPTAVTLTYSQTNISCNGTNDGAITITASGGYSPYYYSNDGGNTFQTTGNFNSLSPANYDLKVKDSLYCPSTITTITLTEPSVLSVIISSSTNVSCNGGNDGSATATASGGTTSYSYLWSSGGTAATEINLAAGSYSVTVTDANFCMATVNATITEPSALIADAGMDATICAGTSAVIGGTPAASGGTPTYSYSWNPATGLTSATIDNPIASPATTQSYTLNITDANGCNSSDIITVTVTPAPTVNAGADVSVCANNPNISLSGTSSTGSAIWSTSGLGSFSPSSADLNATYVPDATDISAGTVVIVLTSTNNGICFAVSDTLVATFMASPIVNAGTDVSVCDGTSATLSASGAITYLWSNGSTTQNITVTPSVSTFYSVTGTDANGCTASDTVNVTVNLNPTASAYTVNTITCNGGNDGQAAVNASSGTTPYSYLWNTGATTTLITGLVADTFNVTVTDANGCWVEAYTVVTEPSLLVANAGNDTTIFQGGTATLTVTASGGTGTYFYLWSNGATAATISSTLTSTSTYSVTVTDANGCSAVDSVNVFVIGFSISGTIYNSDYTSEITAGAVYLIDYDTALAQQMFVDSFALNGVSGNYSFANVNAGDYLIYVYPDESAYPNAMPTYYGDTTFWEGATVILVSSTISNADIGVREISQGSGMGLISGFIQFGIGTGKTGTGTVVPFGDPVPGVDVSLEQIPGGIVRHTESDNNGSYSFANLPLDKTYRLFVDIPGLPMDSTYTVNLNSTDSVETGLDYVVDTTSGSAGIYIGFPLGTSDLGFGTLDFKIYPNPNNGKFQVSVFSNQLSVFSVKIYNVLGEKVFSLPFGKGGDGLVDISNHPSGIYFIKITSGGKTHSQRIILTD